MVKKRPRVLLKTAKKSPKVKKLSLPLMTIFVVLFIVVATAIVLNILVRQNTSLKETQKPSNQTSSETLTNNTAPQLDRFIDSLVYEASGIKNLVPKEKIVRVYSTLVRYGQGTSPQIEEIWVIEARDDEVSPPVFYVLSSNSYTKILESITSECFLGKPQPTLGQFDTKSDVRIIIPLEAFCSTAIIYDLANNKVLPLTDPKNLLKEEYSTSFKDHIFWGYNGMKHAQSNTYIELFLGHAYDQVSVFVNTKDGTIHDIVYFD